MKHITSGLLALAGFLLFCCPSVKNGRECRSASAHPLSSPDPPESGRNARSKEGLLEFLEKRRARGWTQVPRKVLAFYYTWYGRPERNGRWVHWENVRPEEHEIANSTHYPAKGAYDSQDPEIIDYHLELAQEHGVDGFICTWWGRGTFDDQAFKKVLERAEKRGFACTLYWETVPGSGREKIDRAVNDLVYVLEKYGSHPSFLKVEGKPVLFVYGRVMLQISLSEWQEIIARTESRLKKDFLLIAHSLSEASARAFDGVHTYNICEWVQNQSTGSLRELSRDSYRKAVQTAKTYGKISCVTVIPGYDDTKIRSPGIDAKRMNGETYRILWEAAVEAGCDWVLITSWNEWHEGSEIEPSWEHGDQYVRFTKEFASRFKSMQLSPAKAPENFLSVSQETRKAMQGLFQGTTLALLPDFSGEAAFWLADTGVALKELSWQEVIRPDLFHVKNFPAVLYAGYESYTQTVHEKGDVDRAMIRYLEEGGLLMAIPSGPFPFFYNEAGQPVSSAGKFGFPLLGSGAKAPPSAQGWERPPAGLSLAFAIDTRSLQGLPQKIPFPRSGDLRWRPGAASILSEGDIYMPLAELRDEKGANFGDGIFYVEHKVSHPRGGKNIYAWMRMIDGGDREAILFSLFRLAAEKMARPE